MTGRAYYDPDDDPAWLARQEQLAAACRAENEWTPYGSRFAMRELAEATLQSLETDSLLRMWWRFRLVPAGQWYMIERKPK